MKFFQKIFSPSILNNGPAGWLPKILCIVTGGGEEYLGRNVWKLFRKKGKVGNWNKKDMVVATPYTHVPLSTIEIYFV